VTVATGDLKGVFLPRFTEPRLARIAHAGVLSLGSRRLVRHDDRAGGGKHAADAVADRDPGIGDLAGGAAPHPTPALLQRVHAVRAGMHVGEPAAIGVQRQF